jgi:hypothetical protein
VWLIKIKFLKKPFQPTTALEMAEYIHEFSLNGNKHYNGKVAGF